MFTLLFFSVPVVPLIGAIVLAFAPIFVIMFTLHGTCCHRYNSYQYNRDDEESGIFFFGIRNLYDQFKGSEDNRRVGTALAYRLMDNQDIGN